ncbi:spindle and kinetochore-associated protein 1 isoform X2 [Oenanthe melanoleuca]|uniref:spindle and kinetochore-associated protein 1 isoform X2 n=1 Tax=Oenanthe melanoleuca TaxID=2939378 RepID=UPI0024C127A6|nr:spindle and kinetochore-associated protein 1 isoform X2 [Oenanthe melanoleuca]
MAAWETDLHLAYKSPHSAPRVPLTLPPRFSSALPPLRPSLPSALPPRFSSALPPLRPSLTPALPPRFSSALPPLRPSLPSAHAPSPPFPTAARARRIQTGARTGPQEENRAFSLLAWPSGWESGTGTKTGKHWPCYACAMTKDMGSSSLEDLCFHINTKISNVKKCIQLRDMGEDESCKPMLPKIKNKLHLVHDLLNKMEIIIKRQEKLKDLLKELQKAAERDQEAAQHLLEHIPPYLPKPTKSCITVPTEIQEGQKKTVEAKTAKKPAKEPIVIKEVALITTEEFENIPAYLKGRIAYDQINAVVQQLNKALEGKYKVLHQPLKSMSVPVRNLYHRFMEEETKDTKGVFFIVEADIREFTQLKLDKRFHSILSILRHCQRVRELRSSGLIRYIVC